MGKLFGHSILCVALARKLSPAPSSDNGTESKSNEAELDSNWTNKPYYILLAVQCTVYTSLLLFTVSIKHWALLNNFWKA